jgi:hypothetical protein
LIASTWEALRSGISRLRGEDALPTSGRREKDKSTRSSRTGYRMGRTE